jgi:outer membrane biosynthesis protein TonB
VKPQRIRNKFRHAAPSRLPRGAAVSAAILAAAATGGILLSQTPSQAQPQGRSTISRAEMARDTVSKASRSEVRTVAVPAPSTPAQAPAPAPSTPAPAPSTPGQPPAPAQPPAPVPPPTPPPAPAQPPTPPPAPAQPPTPPPSKVLDYQFQLQPNYYYCGPAATRIALSTSGRALSQDEIARKLGTTTSGTNSANDTTRGLNSVLGGNVYQTRSIPGPSATPAQMDQLQADVVSAINNGRGLVTNIVHSVTDTNGGWHTYDGGHYVAVVGYQDNGRVVKIADPANSNGDGTYWVTTINLANWIATHGYSF